MLCENSTKSARACFKIKKHFKPTAVSTMDRLEHVVRMQLILRHGNAHAHQDVPVRGRRTVRRRRRRIGDVHVGGVPGVAGVVAVVELQQVVRNGNEEEVQGLHERARRADGLRGIGLPVDRVQRRS